MNGKFAKAALIIIAFADALIINLSDGGVMHDIALRVMLFFLSMIPTLLVGCLLKKLCSCNN